VIGVSVGTDPRALSHVLFGNPLTMTAAEVAAHVVLAATVVAAIVLCLPVLMATTFDPGHARTLGVRTGLVDTGVIVGLGLVVVVGLTTVGVLMALALCIAPATAARLLSARIGRVLALAGLLGCAAGLAGLLASYHLGLPAGPTVAVLAVAEVAVAVVARSAATAGRRRRAAPDDRRVSATSPAVASAAPGR
jgi:ABC-type Mn2+/Zn2+ transport system permease subunit